MISEKFNMRNLLPRVSATVVLLGGFALGACSERFLPPPSFGDATAQNEAVQVVDPEPVHGEEAPAMAGTRVGLALKRYDTGTVTKPEDVKVEDSGGSSN